MAVTLFPGANEFHFIFDAFLTKLHLCRAEVLEDGEMSLAPQDPFQFLCQCNATANHHHVNIVGRAFQENIPHIAAYDIALQTQAVCCLTDQSEHRLIQDRSQFFI